MSAILHATMGAWRRDRSEWENDQPGQNEELVPKRGDYICTAVLKLTDFKLLKHK